VHLYIELDLSDTDNILPLENITPIFILINLLCILLFDLFILINRSGIFKWYNVFIVRWIWFRKRTRYRDKKKLLNYMTRLSQGHGHQSVLAYMWFCF